MSISRSFSIVSVALLLVSPITASADVPRGDQFITEMDGNKLSGTNAAGLAFSIHFLTGGHVTFTNIAGARVNGTWHRDQGGNVCIQWQNPVDAMDGCFRMSIDGDTVVWRRAT